ncbi:MAG TPA: squalene synthase HpnC [Mycobacteriales bacterium]|nr:squalene synthase HpnC [Mycobacteriales bacterium]
MALVDIDDAAALRRLERAENFPVALRFLPPRYRRDLRAVYDVARVIDDAGDDPHATSAERLRRLDFLAADLQTAFAGGTPRLAPVQVLRPAIADGRLAPEPFLDLIEANRRDQTVTRYPSYDDLLGYCALSAEPVGRIVLAVFGVDDRQARALSDRVCTALQLLEHCQDVAEDKRDRDRVYLPMEDLAHFGVADSDLDVSPTPPPLRQAVARQVDRAAVLLEDGSTLVRRLHGAARVAIAGYAAGGLATVDALRRSDYDVCTQTPVPRKRDVVTHGFRLLVGAR